MITEKLNQIKQGKSGKLAGLGIIIKSNINVLGLICNCASKTLENYKSTYNATVIEKYNYKNNMISQLIYKEEDFETKKMRKYNVSYSYKYDQYKNWIEIIKTVDGKDLYKWKREIEYY